jgi:hypothetical protein
MSEQSDRTTGPAEAPDIETLAADVASIIGSTLNVVTGLARTTAELSARERLLEPPNAHTPPLNAIIHYGLITVVNIAGLVTSAARDSGESVKPPPTGRPATTAQQGLPTLRPGATLRMPLSVENRGDEAMTEVVPHVVELQYTGPDAATALDASAVRFEPERLTIEAHDFEKVKVIVMAAQNSAPGHYTLTIAFSTDVTTVIHFAIAS